MRADDLAHCRALLARGSKSFSTAALLLPEDIRDAATVFYAFCRVADDAVDESDDPRAVVKLEARVHAVYAGRPGHDPVDRALSAMVAERRVPRELFDALVEGFAWDREGRRYETISELRGYAARVAGSVGAVMTVLMGVRSRSALARACDLGVAMQLTNIARDVGEDARHGRVYLPAGWLAEAGVATGALERVPRFSPALGSVVARLLNEASMLYVRAEPGFLELPASCRSSMWAARLVYAEIGAVIAVRGHDSVSSRATVSATRKAQLLTIALYRARRAVTRPEGADVGPLAEVAFLVSAAADPSGLVPELSAP